MARKPIGLGLFFGFFFEQRGSFFSRISLMEILTSHAMWKEAVHSEKLNRKSYLKFWLLFLSLMRKVWNFYSILVIFWGRLKVSFRILGISLSLIFLKVSFASHIPYKPLPLRHWKQWVSTFSMWVLGLPHMSWASPALLCDTAWCARLWRGWQGFMMTHYNRRHGKLVHWQKCRFIEGKENKLFREKWSITTCY